MKEVCTCFSEMELIQNWWMSHEKRQVLESKDAKKQESLDTQCGEDFALQDDKPLFFSSFFPTTLLY